MDGLRGFVGQSMGGVKTQDNPASYVFGGGTHTFTAPRSGSYKFVMWGHGGAGNGSQSGASSGYSEITKTLGVGQTVALVVARAATATNTGTMTFPDGTVVTIAGANFSTAGASPTGGDLNVSGVAGSTTSSGINGPDGTGTNPGSGGTGTGALDGGAGAPGYGTYKGGRGGNGATTPGAAAGNAPGGGAGYDQSNVGAPGGGGLVIVDFLR